MESVQESLLVEEEKITPIPSMEAYVVGLMSSRDRVFCLIDLPLFLGVTDKLVSSRRVYHTVVTRVPGESDSEKELLFGFAFYRVQGVTRINSEQMESVTQELPSSLKPYLVGYFSDREQQLPVLDLANIVKQVQVIET
jgi:twitching motility protein PilI